MQRTLYMTRAEYGDYELYTKNPKKRSAGDCGCGMGTDCPNYGRPGNSEPVQSFCIGEFKRLSVSNVCSSPRLRPRRARS